MLIESEGGGWRQGEDNEVGEGENVKNEGVVVINGTGWGRQFNIVMNDLDQTQRNQKKKKKKQSIKVTDTHLH